MLFFLFPEEELRRPVRAARLRRTPPTPRGRTSTTTTSGPRTDRPSASSPMPRVLADARPRELVGALPGRAGERRRRRPGRHHQGGHPHGRDVGHARPRPARRTWAARSATGCSYFAPEADRAARRAVVLDAIPRDADPRDARGRRAHGGRAEPRASADPIQVGAGRRGPRALRRASSCTFTLEYERRSDGYQGSEERSSTSTACWSTRRTSAAWREALAASSWRASGATSGTRRPGRRRRFTPQVYQQVMSGKPRMEGARAALDYFEVPDAGEPRAGVRRPQAGDGHRAHRGREFTAYPDALRFVLGDQGRRDPDRGRVVVEERRAVPAADPAGRVRRGAGPQLRLRHGGADPARLLRRRHLGPRLPAGQAASRDLPHRRPGARGPAERAASWSRTRSPASRRRRRARWRRSGLARADDEEILAAAGADLVVTTLDDVDLDGLSEGRLAKRDLARKDG